MGEPASPSQGRDQPGDRDGPERAESNERCPECGSTTFERDPQRGEVTCAMCGLVLSEGEIDHGPEWRAFNPQQRESRARTGPGRTIMRHDLGLGTVIGYGNERGMSGKSRAQLARMRRYHRQATYRPGADRELVRALTEIERLANALNLPDQVAETAAQIYRQARKQNFLHGRSVEATAAASVYAAARIQKVPRPLDEVANKAQSDDQSVARTYRKLSQELELPVPITYPEDLLPSFASRLELPARVEAEARKLIDRAGEENVTGKNPASVAAAALYKAAKELGEHRTQQQVAEAAGVTEVTVRARLKDLEPDGANA